MKSKFLTMKFILGALILSFSCACSNSNSEEAMPQTAIGRQLVESGMAKIIDGYESLFVNWYGGEPLLYIPTIEYLSKKLMGICSKKKKSYMVSIRATTRPSTA